MHIGFVAHNFIRGNGQGRINLETARYAARQGHRVTLLAGQVDDDLAAEPGVAWQPIRPRPAKPDLIACRRAAGAADRLLRRNQFDFDVVVGAGYTLTAPHAVNLCQFVHAAWLASPVHVACHLRGPRAWYQRAYTRCNVAWEKAAYAAAGMVVAPSEKIRTELLAIGVPAERIRVIYNGVDLDEFHPRNTPDAAPAERAALGLPPTGPLALFVGDIRTTRKNLDSVLKALPAVPGLRLAVVGAVERSPFPAMARDLGVADRVTFAGFRRDVDRFMRAADLFVFPSRYEAGTLVLIEALASGLPVVTARTAGGCEVMDAAAGTILDDPDDLDALAAAMRRWTTDAAARHAAAEAARGIATQHAWSRMAAAYLDLFTAAAEQRSADNSMATLCPAGG